MKHGSSTYLASHRSMPRRLALLLCFVVCSLGAFAQSKVSGTVVDATGAPIIGASVVIKGSSAGAVTDMDGRWTVDKVPAGSTLVISYVGFKTQEIPVNGRSSIDVKLQEDNQSLDEIVVVGYGVQKKSDVTGAMISVDAKKLTERPVSNVFDAMQGKAAGVDIRTSDRPGEMGDVYIRGMRSLSASSSPLYVVDGVPLNTTVGTTFEEDLDAVGGRYGALESLNPQDIESVEILKDASATAIYGSRGANGVVLVTTKKGSQGRFQVNYSGSVTVQDLVERTKYFSAGDYITWRRWAYYYRDPVNNPRGDQPTVEKDKVYFNGDNDPYTWANIMKGWAGGTWDGSKVETTDWADFVTRTGVATEHTVSASGGTEKANTYVSFGWLDNVGVIKGQDYNRYTGKVSADLKPFKWLSIGASVNATYSLQNYGMSNDGGTTSGDRNALSASRRNLPFTVPYDNDGNIIEYPGADSKIKTVIGEWDKSVDERKTFRALGSFYAQVNIGEIWKPLKGLNYKVNFGPDFRYFRYGVFNDATSVNREGVNYAKLTKNTDFSWTLDNMLFYNRTFGRHAVGVTLLQTATDYNFETSSMSAQGIPIPESLWNALTTTNVSALTSWNSGLTEKSLESYMARVKYTFNDRYMLTASVRWDGASQLAQGHKWSAFPSFALGWRMDQEEFMKNVHWISQLKLRLGYGVTGNAAISPYQTKARIASLFYPFGSASTAGYTAYEGLLGSAGKLAMANQNLGWEKTHQWNLGVDFSFFNGRISGVFDIYTSRTTDLLMQQSIPAMTGYMTTYNNVGKTKNFGYDLTLNFVPVQTRDFEWTIGVNAAYAKNEITELANGKEDDIVNGWFIGESIGAIYDYVSDGIWQENDAEEMAKFNANGNKFQVGMLKPKDLNGDHKIDATNDRAIVGHTVPRWTVGLNTNLSWRSWDFAIQLYGRMDYTYTGGNPWVGGRYNVRAYNYYNENNKTATYNKPIFDEGGGDVYYGILGRDNGSYLKIRNISLGYTFPKRWIGQIGITNLRLYAQCTNPGFVFCNVDYADPDTYSSSFNRGFTFGVNLSF